MGPPRRELKDINEHNPNESNDNLTEQISACTTPLVETRFH
jgi:hypothetical protein